MFIVRSLFWLIAAFMVIAPHADIAETARTAPWATFNATQTALAGHLPHLACDSFECVGARALLTSATSGAPSTPVSPPPAPNSIAPAPGEDLIAGVIARHMDMAVGTTQVSDNVPAAPTPQRRPSALL